MLALFCFRVSSTTFPHCMLSCLEAVTVVSLCSLVIVCLASSCSSRRFVSSEYMIASSCSRGLSSGGILS